MAACGSAPTAATTDIPPATDIPSATETIEVEPTETATAAATETLQQPAAVSFANDILPLLESRCAGCHGGQRTEAELNLRSFDSLMAGSKNGAVVIAGDAATSKLVTLVAEGKMPKRGPKLTPDQVQLITDWIDAGALNN
jgi:mono/diheme cytochrome c family protein